MHSEVANWRRILPNLATSLTLLLGLGAIEAARSGDADLALRFILLAVLADGIDGVLARRLGVASSFGGHLDALADLVAFGIAPGVLFATQNAAASGPVRIGLIACIALAGAWRLARFQADAPRSEFVGLPITVGGPLFALAVGGVLRADLGGAIAWGIALAILMVSRVPYPRFTSGRLGRAAWISAAVFIALLVIDGRGAMVIAHLGLATYVIWGLWRGFVVMAPRTRQVTDDRARRD